MQKQKEKNLVTSELFEFAVFELAGDYGIFKFLRNHYLYCKSEESVSFLKYLCLEICFLKKNIILKTHLKLAKDVYKIEKFPRSIYKITIRQKCHSSLVIYIYICRHK